MNQPEVKAALGVNPQRTFESCNMGITKSFLLQGDAMHNTAALLPPLINDGVRLLVYAGNAGGYICPSFHSVSGDLICRVGRYDV